MERGAGPASRAARAGTAEIGLAVAATTFSIIAVFVPVAFMGGVARANGSGPSRLTVAASVLVSLFISFTLDPMLSAYWGDPAGPPPSAQARALAAVLGRFNAWFDHQSDRYGRVIAWALHHRRWMALIAVASLVGGAGAAGHVGGSSFLPALRRRHRRRSTCARLPAAASNTRSARSRRRRRWPARCPRRWPPTSYVNAGGGRIYVDIGKSTQRKRTAARDRARSCATLLARLVGAEYMVLDDLNNGVRRSRCRSSSPAPTRSACMAITNALHGAAGRGAGRGRRGPVGAASPRTNCKIELDRGLANAAGHLRRRRGAGAARGLCRRGGRRLGRPHRRNARRGRAPASRRPRRRLATSSACRLPWVAAVRWCRWSRSPPSRWARARRRSSTPDGKRTITVSANVQGRVAGRSHRRCA